MRPTFPSFSPFPPNATLDNVLVGYDNDISSLWVETEGFECVIFTYV
jgi:hypothetical protein